MGKVASWTVIKTIQAAVPSMVLCDLDHVSDAPDAIVHLHDPRLFERHLRETRGRHRDLIVVTLVRDPLRMAIAAFFQNITSEEKPHLNFGSKDAVLVARGEDLVRFFRKFAAEELAAYQDIYTRQWGAALGIDAFRLSYGEDGVASGSFTEGRYIVVRVHRLSDARNRLGKLIGVDLPLLHMDNMAKDKWYSPAYGRFFETFSPTPSEISTFYESPFARANFSPDDIKGFENGWPLK